MYVKIYSHDQLIYSCMMFLMIKQVNFNYCSYVGMYVHAGSSYRAAIPDYHPI